MSFSFQNLSRFIFVIDLNLLFLRYVRMYTSIRFFRNCELLSKSLHMPDNTYFFSFSTIYLSAISYTFSNSIPLCLPLSFTFSLSHTHTFYYIFLSLSPFISFSLHMTDTKSVSFYFSHSYFCLKPGLDKRT